VTSVNDSIYLIGADTLKVGSPKLNKNAWLQGLNTFGATGKLGTFDNYNVEFYTNHIKAAMIDTFGSFRINNANHGTIYKLDVGGGAWLGTFTRVGSSDGQYDIVMTTTSQYGYSPNTTSASILSFGDSWGSIGVNRTAMGNIPAGSINIGGTSPFRLLTLDDGSWNPVITIDGIGTATINGGYNGITTGGSAGVGADKSAYNFQVNGGRGTGAGAPGNIVFATGNSQTSGTTIHSMTNRWWIAGGTGYLANPDTATSSIDVRGANGYSQFRMRTSYTPTSTSDTNGNVGDFSWDDNYFYYKTSVGWKRIAAGTF